MRPVKRLVCSGSFAQAVWKKSAEDLESNRRDLASTAELPFFYDKEERPSECLKRKRCEWEFCACAGASCFLSIE